MEASTPKPETALIDKIRAVADFIPVSHIPAVSEVAKVVGALVAYVEHGDNLFTMAEHGAATLAHLVAGADDPIAAAEAAKGAGQPQTPEQQQIAQLKIQLQDANARLAAETGASTGPAGVTEASSEQQEIADLRAQLAAQAAAVAASPVTPPPAPAPAPDASQAEEIAALKAQLAAQAPAVAASPVDAPAPDATADAPSRPLPTGFGA